MVPVVNFVTNTLVITLIVKMEASVFSSPTLPIGANVPKGFLVMIARLLHALTIHVFMKAYALLMVALFHVNVLVDLMVRPVKFLYVKMNRANQLNSALNVLTMMMDQFLVACAPR